MAPRIKILMAYWSKKGTQIYFSFLSKVPANEYLQLPQQDPYGEIYSSTGHFAYLSKIS